MRILIADDDVKLREMLREALSLRGYEVQVAADGYDALIKVGSFRPHLLLLDLRMPGVDGSRVCQAVKSHSLTFDTKVLVMTGSAASDGRALIRATGAEGLLHKPFHLPHLHEALQRVLVPGDLPERATAALAMR